MRIAFYGSSLLSSYWNGAATYYRGLIAALAELGWRTTFYEPDAFDRQQNRDIDPPDWDDVVVYKATPEGLGDVLGRVRQADVVVKASGVGVFDDELLGVFEAASADALRIFWDVDAPATLAVLRNAPEAPLRKVLPRLDLVLTYGGGPPVVAAYESLGARRCVPIYNAVDPSTHHPARPDPRFSADLALLANRLPDRESRIDSFFLAPAAREPNRRFLLGGSGWSDKALPANVQLAGHVGVRDHNRFNATPLAVLNVSRESMAETGYSPATRVFEAAGAGACLITDFWEGLGMFLEPGAEILVARDGRDVLECLAGLDRTTAANIGDAARRRVLASHTYDRRAVEVDAIFRAEIARRRERSAA